MQRLPSLLQKSSRSDADELRVPLHVQNNHSKLPYISTKDLGLHKMNGDLFKPGAPQSYQSNMRALAEHEQYLISQVPNRSVTIGQLQASRDCDAQAIEHRMRTHVFNTVEFWTAGNAPALLERVKRQGPPGFGSINWRRYGERMYAMSYGDHYRRAMRRALQSFNDYDTEQAKLITLWEHVHRIQEYGESAGMGEEELREYILEHTFGSYRESLKQMFNNRKDITVLEVVTELELESRDLYGRAVAHAAKSGAPKSLAGRIGNINGGNPGWPRAQRWPQRSVPRSHA